MPRYNAHKKSKSKVPRKRIISITVVLALLLSLGGTFAYFKFFKKDTPEPVKKKPKEEQSLKIVDPNSKTRIEAVSIDNVAEAYPQKGLQDAFIVYEFLVEGGATRLVALYKDQNLKEIGPVRSARHYFIDYVMENDAIFVHFGRSPRAEKEINDFDIADIDGITADTAFWRASDYVAPHNAFTSSERISKFVKNAKYDSESDTPLLLNYSVKPVVFAAGDGAQPTTDVTIYYSQLSTEYKYNPETKSYEKYSYGDPHMDANTDKVVSVKNIIVAQVPMFPLTGFGAGDGRQDTNNVGSGTGYFITEGQYIPIKWEKKSREAQTKYYKQDGSPLKVNDGNTFIQMQPEGFDLLFN